MYTLQYKTDEYDEDGDGINFIQLDLDEDANLDQLMGAFNTFLKVCGFEVEPGDVILKDPITQEGNVIHVDMFNNKNEKYQEEQMELDID